METTDVKERGAQTAAELTRAAHAHDARVPMIQHRVWCNHDEQHGCGKDTGARVQLPFDASPAQVKKALHGVLCEPCGSKHSAARLKTELEQDRLLTKMLGAQTDEPVMVRMARRFEELQQRLDKLEGRASCLT